MLIKQGKQNRILYELQKTSLERISWLQTQLKKLSSDKSHELSLKVFNVLSTDYLVCIILSHLDIYYYKLFITILYRMDIVQYALNFFQTTCGQSSRNINNLWKNG